MSFLKMRHLGSAAELHPVPHRHAEGQVFFVRQGMVSVTVEGGRWVMPPGCLGWVPSGVSHAAQGHGAISGASLYVSQSWAEAHMPSLLRTVAATPLLTALLDEIGRIGTDAPRDLYLRAFADCFGRQPVSGGFLPMPRDARLLGMTDQMMQRPDDTTDLDGWSARIGMSRRSLTRHFQQETGVSIGRWRQQMRLVLAIEKLVAGLPVTSVALDAGYQNASSFIAIFKRQFGVTPGSWIASRRNPPE